MKTYSSHFFYVGLCVVLVILGEVLKMLEEEGVSLNDVEAAPLDPMYVDR